MEVMEIVVYVKKIIVYFDNFYFNINEIWFFFEDIVYEYELQYIYIRYVINIKYFLDFKLLSIMNVYYLDLMFF